MPEGIVLLILLFLAIIAVVGIIGYLQEKKRREAFLALARELGLSYDARDYSIPQRYRFLDALRQGSNHYAFNVLRGQFEGYPVQAFDYHYETHSTDSKGRRQTHHHYFSYFILEQGKEFPELRIYPEGLLSKLGQMLGYADIDFESIEFSKAFCVRSADRKFAYDICHPRMMEYLLAHRELSLEIEARCVAMSFNRRLNVEEITSRLAQLVDIVNLFPEYLYRG